MRTISDHAVILKRINYGEADKIITVLTKSNGKVVLIAKGVRKITSRRKGHLELFSHVKISYTQSSGLGYITEVETIDIFADHQTVWEPLGHLFHVSELVDKLIPEDEEQEYVYRLLLRALTVLSQESDHERREEIIRLFERSLLTDLGYWNYDEQSYGVLNNDQKKQIHLNVIEEIIERQLNSNLVFGFK